MREYGNSIRITHVFPGWDNRHSSLSPEFTLPEPTELPLKQWNEALRLLCFNFEETKKQRPDFHLPDDCVFRIGPVTKKMEFNQEDWVWVAVPDTFEFTFGWYCAVEDQKEDK